MHAHNESAARYAGDIAAPSPDDSADECSGDGLASLMKRVVLSLARDADQRLGAQGLTTAQLRLLLKLRGTGSSTVADLARACEVNAGAMTRMLDRVEKKHFCRRARSTVDRRVVRVEITPQGDAAAARGGGWPAEALMTHLAGFTDAECRTLEGYLQRILRAAEAMRDSA